MIVATNQVSVQPLRTQNAEAVTLAAAVTFQPPVYLPDRSDPYPETKENSQLGDILILTHIAQLTNYGVTSLIPESTASLRPKNQDSEFDAGIDQR